MWWARTFHANRRGKGTENIPQYQRVSPILHCDFGALPFLKLWWLSSSQAFPSPTYVPHSFTPRYWTPVFSSCQDSSPLSAVFAISSIGKVCFAASTMVLGSSFFLNYYFIVWKSEATCPRSSRLWWARQELMLPLLLVLSLDWDRCGGDSILGIVFTLGRTWWWRAEYSFNRSLGLPWWLRR